MNDKVPGRVLDVSKVYFELAIKVPEHLTMKMQLSQALQSFSCSGVSCIFCSWLFELLMLRTEP